MSVTFSINVETPAIWVIECACGAVNAVSSYVSYEEAFEARECGVAPLCGDDYCAGDRVYITTAEDAETEQYTLNVSNVNAKFILGVLGLLSYELDEDGNTSLDLCGSATGEELLQRVLLAQEIEPHDLGAQSIEHVALRAETLSDGSMVAVKGATIIDCGRHEGYLDERLIALRDLAVKAQELNLTISWC